MRTAFSAQILVVALASFAAFLYVRAARNDERLTSCSALCEMGPAYAGRDRLAPDFELPDLNGRPVRLSTYFGKPIVLNFWTQSCEPCKKELPSLGELAALGAERGFTVLTVSADDGPDEIAGVLQEIFHGQAPPFPVLFDPDLKIIQGKYGTVLYPETWLIDSARVIRSRFDGEKNWSSPLSLETVESLRRPSGCPVEFSKGLPVGQFAGLCPAR